MKTLKSKTAYGMLSLVIAMLAVTALAVSLTNQSVVRLTEMLRRVSIANHLSVLVGEPNMGLPYEIGEYANNPTPEKRQAISDSFAVIGDELAKFSRLSKMPSAHSEMGLLQNAFDSYHQGFLKLQTDVSAHVHASIINAEVVRIKDDSVIIKSLVQKLVSAQLSADLAEVTRIDTTKQFQWIAILFIVVSGTAAVGFIFFKLILMDLVIAPIKHLQGVMTRLHGSSADLTARAEVVSDDEIGQLARSFNLMADGLKKANDILEDKVHERTRELVDSQQRLLQATKMSALGEMAGGIAHEINTPLAIIGLNIEMLEAVAEEAANGDVKSVEVLGRARKISETVDRIAVIVKGLKTYSRDTSNDDLTLVKASTIAQDTLALCSEKFRSHGITVQVEDKSQGESIRCRPAEICQVVLNLLNNSFDAVREQDAPKITLTLVATDTAMAFSVEDNGPGIGDSIKEKLFDPFFTTKDVGSGTGLGLSISRSIIEKHGGKMTFTSQPGATMFCGTLPKAG